MRDSSKIAQSRYQIDKVRSIPDKDRMIDCPELCEIL